MKLYYWQHPYDVAWGSAHVCVMAATLKEARHLAEKACRAQLYGRGASIVLGKPTHVYRSAKALAFEWSE